MFDDKQAKIEINYHLDKKFWGQGYATELSKALIQWGFQHLSKINPRFGCLRIALQIKSAFGIEIEKGVVKRVLDKHYKPAGGSDGPSWLTFKRN